MGCRTGPRPGLRSDGFPTGGRATMADDPDHQVQEPRPPAAPAAPPGLLLARQYGLVLLLILVTYALSAAATPAWAVAGPVRSDRHDLGDAPGLPGPPPPPQVTGALLVISAAVRNPEPLLSPDRRGFMAVVSGLLYVAAPVIIVRQLVPTYRGQPDRPRRDRRLPDGREVVRICLPGARDARPARSLGRRERAASEDLFFSFTTLTTTGYGNLVPATNPGQTLAVGEMLIGNCSW